MQFMLFVISLFLVGLNTPKSLSDGLAWAVLRRVSAIWSRAVITSEYLPMPSVTGTEAKTSKLASVKTTKKAKSISPALSSLEIDLLAYDGGNRGVKGGYGDKRVIYPSYQTVKKTFQDIDLKKIPPNSWVIEDGSITYLVGNVAAQFQAIPTYQQNKWEISKPLFYGLLGALKLSGDLKIKTLRLATPDTQDASQVERLLSLKGSHHVVINGKALTVRVGAVQIFDEGVPAWVNACQSNVWQFPKALNGILDLGGGTAIARLVTAQGAVVRQSELILPGTFELANKIGSYLGVNCVGPLILDAIENQTYMLPSGVNFKAQFLGARDEWLTTIRAELKSRWASFAGQYGQVLVVGGSAPLAIDLVSSSSRYLMAENPQMFALEGLING